MKMPRKYWLYSGLIDGSHELKDKLREDVLHHVMNLSSLVCVEICVSVGRVKHNDPRVSKGVIVITLHLGNKEFLLKHDVH